MRGEVIEDRRTFVVACLGGALSALDSMVNIAFPDITAAFGIDVSSLQWVVVSYVLVYAALLLPFGRLADRVGHEVCLRAGLALSVVAFAGCGLANAFPVLLAARVVQGVGIALVLAAAPALITLSVPDSGRSRALGRFQLSVAAGFAAGPPLGGLLLAVTSWRAVFLVRVPLALALLGLAVLGRRRAAAPAGSPSLDLPGAITFATGLAMLLFVATRGAVLGWTAPSTIALAITAVALLAAFVVVERRAAQPLVDLSLFRRPAFAVANVLNGLANATMFAIWLLGPTLLVTVRGQGIVAAGFTLGVTALGTAVAAPLAGRLTDRVGVGRLSTAGLTLQAIGLYLTSRIGATTPTAGVVVAFALVGAGLGLFQVPNLSYVMGSLPRAQQGVAGGMSQMVRTAGIVSGVAAANVLFVARRAAAPPGASEDEAFVAAFGDVLLVAAVVCAAAAVASLARSERSSPSSSHGGES